MGIFSSIAAWWKRNNLEFAKPTLNMTDDELKTEYTTLYDRAIMHGTNNQDDFRMANIENTLKNRHIYVVKGVKVCFVKY